ncbi:hypothetical protein EVAR_101795_1 [Eumeta japonica]|uniref:Uncharacterized protein n=1 Tax=Eumeta variegata TaxID=151549 RepID=A0A4C1SQF1_EUMVA|nr:hypothetical protein EVAR_101795_1 [Eumeta japonica]
MSGNPESKTHTPDKPVITAGKPNVVFASNSGSSTVFDFNPGHALDSYYDPTFCFDSGTVLNFSHVRLMIETDKGITYQQKNFDDGKGNHEWTSVHGYVIGEDDPKLSLDQRVERANITESEIRALEGATFHRFKIA